MLARRWAPWLVGVVLALGGWAVVLTPAYACSCAERSDQEVYDSAETVFRGVMTTVERTESGSSGAPVYFTFVVSEVYKGSARSQQVVLTAASSASCGDDFAPDETYLVFARGLGGTGQLLSTDSCSGTRTGAAPASYGEPQPPTTGSTVRADDSPLGRLVETPIWILAAVVGLAVIAWAALVVRRARTQT